MRDKSNLQIISFDNGPKLQSEGTTEGVLACKLAANDWVLPPWQFLPAGLRL